MAKYVIQRILLAFATTFIILTLTFFFMKLLPFYPAVGTDTAKFAYYMDQTGKGNLWYFSEAHTELGEYLWYYNNNGVDYYFYLRPAWDLYINWLVGIFTRFDWGSSIYISPNVNSMVIIFGTSLENSRMWTTIKINFWAVIISVPVGILLGILAALKKNTWIDHTISTLVMVFISIPSFIIITLFLSWFSYGLGWLPTQWPSSAATTETKIKAYILPVLCLSFGSICGYCRFTRAELTEVMSSDFLLLARTKGLTRRQSITRHALKNAMVPILPSILSEVVGLLGGSMILESLYGIPGVGRLYITALQSQDYNVLMADMSLYTIIGLLSGVILDLSYGFIDPRIRMGAKK